MTETNVQKFYRILAEKIETFGNIYKNPNYLNNSKGEQNEVS